MKRKPRNLGTKDHPIYVIKTTKFTLDMYNELTGRGKKKRSTKK